MSSRGAIRVKKFFATILLVMGTVTTVWSFFEIVAIVGDRATFGGRSLFRSQVFECTSPDDCKDKTYTLGQLYRKLDGRMAVHLFAEGDDRDNAGRGFCTTAFKGPNYDECEFKTETMVDNRCADLLSFVFWRGDDFTHAKLHRCKTQVQVIGQAKAIRYPLVRGWMLILALASLAVSVTAARILIFLRLRDEQQ